VTEVKSGDKITLTMTGTVSDIGSDYMGLDLEDGEHIYLEASGDTADLDIEVHAPPKIPHRAEVIRWAVEHDGNYIWRYANVAGHPGNGVWWVCDHARQVETKNLLSIIGDANVEVLKELE
jgi:hypothetical protein